MGDAAYWKMSIWSSRGEMLQGGDCSGEVLVDVFRGESGGFDREGRHGEEQGKEDSVRAKDLRSMNQKREELLFAKFRINLILKK